MKNRDLTITPERIKKIRRTPAGAGAQRGDHRKVCPRPDCPLRLSGRAGRDQGGAAGVEGNVDRELRPGQRQRYAGRRQLLFTLLWFERPAPAALENPACAVLE